jgi:EAL domain-containing protein (putative c-di-GMP-specific phosphodiesterase class I)
MGRDGQYWARGHDRVGLPHHGSDRREYRRCGIRIAVNLSARQFRQPDVVSMIQQAIAQHGRQPHNIEIELTESIVMSDADRSIETLHQLTRLGLHIAVDEFGTGYSSIGYLKRLPVSVLKIDRSFVVDLGTSTKSNAVVKAVISLAHSLGMSVVTGESKPKCN